MRSFYVECERNGNRMTPWCHAWVVGTLKARRDGGSCCSVDGTVAGGDRVT
jgi:hypothetical protein